jgi:hypothetical protein
LDLLACAYRNGTDRMVIVRCEGRDGFYLERVVFPFELLTFQGPSNSDLEIWTHGLGGPELIDRLPVRDLSLEEQLDGGLSGRYLELVHGGPGLAMDDDLEAAAG